MNHDSGANPLKDSTLSDLWAIAHPQYLAHHRDARSLVGKLFDAHDEALAEFAAAYDNSVGAATNDGNLLLQGIRTRGEQAIGNLRRVLRDLHFRIPTHRKFLCFRWRNKAHDRERSRLETELSAARRQLEEAERGGRARMADHLAAIRHQGDEDRRQLDDKHAASAHDAIARIIARNEALTAALDAIVEAAARLPETAGDSRPLTDIRVGTLRYEMLGWDQPEPTVLESPWLMNTGMQRGLVVRGGAQASLWLHAWLYRMANAYPAGLLRFTLVDPDSLGGVFSRWLELGDSAADLLGGRVWTETREIEARLADLKKHVVRLTQRVLRDAYDDLWHYNGSNPEAREPWHLLVIRQPVAGWPPAIPELIFHLFKNGPRCGVMPCILLGEEMNTAGLDPTGSAYHTILFRDGQVAGTLVPPSPWRTSWEPQADCPSANPGPRLREIAALAARRATVSVDYAGLLRDEGITGTHVHRDGTAEGLVIPLGKSDTGVVLRLELGTAAQNAHMLVGGRPGSGKSTLIHAMVATACRMYAPRELRVFLLDFKRGVEFMPYVNGRLPHAKVLSVESDREFGLSVLHYLKAELDRRARLFNRHQAADIRDFRRVAGEDMPRLLLVIDEFQMLFGGQDRLASDACHLLDELIRQGRAFGLHIVLATQAFQAGWSLSAATLAQISVRVALACEDRVSRQILGEDNQAARALTRPGEAIYNARNGVVSGNHRFQVVNLDRNSLPELLHRIRSIHGDAWDCEVFDGRHLPDARTHAADFAVREDGLIRLLPGLAAEMGETAAIHLDRCKGRNVVFFSDAPALRLSHWNSFLACLRHQEVERIVLDGATGRQALPADAIAGSGARVISRKELAPALAALRGAVQAGNTDRPQVLLIHAPQHLTELRHDPIALMQAGAGAGGAAADFAWLLQHGPENGLHTVLISDRPSSLVQSIDPRSRLIECFDIRASGRLSEDDSRRLHQSAVAAGLGAHGAFLWFRCENRGLRYRPFAWDIPETAAAVPKPPPL